MSPDWINIAIFFISAAVAYSYEAFALYRKNIRCPSPKVPFAILIAIAILFTVFTFLTPEIGIFRDPLTGRFGV